MRPAHTLSLLVVGRLHSVSYFIQLQKFSIGLIKIWQVINPIDHVYVSLIKQETLCSLRSMGWCMMDWYKVKSRFSWNSFTTIRLLVRTPPHTLTLGHSSELETRVHGLQSLKRGDSCRTTGRWTLLVKIVFYQLSWCRCRHHSNLVVTWERNLSGQKVSETHSV